MTYRSEAPTASFRFSASFPLIPPKVFEPIGCELRTTDCALTALHAAALPKGRLSSISRLMRCTVPLATPHSAATFNMPFPARSWLWIRFSKAEFDPRPAKLLPRV